MIDNVTHGGLARILIAACAYFAMVFATGFVLGAVRSLVIAESPQVGRLTAVLIELPIMLVASWLMCAATIRLFVVPATFSARALMGGLAFLLLLLAEFLVGAVLFGRSASEHISLYREASYALGLLAQIGFGLMPAIRLYRDRDS